MLSEAGTEKRPSREEEVRAVSSSQVPISHPSPAVSSAFRRFFGNVRLGPRPGCRLAPDDCGGAGLAKFFKFRSADEVEAEGRRLALDLRFSDDLSPLFRPVQVGPLR